MRVIEAIGTILGYILMAIFVLATAALDLYVIARYGLIVWIFVIPLSLMLVGLLFSLGMMAVVGLGVGITKVVAPLLGMGNDKAEK